ncbi:MAG: PAS domain-containing protein [Candidatus Methanoperedens sp.]|nr:PAS domain-containing protein [Candidatus Methanoperedens sp.]
MNDSEKNADEILPQADALFQSLFDLAPDAIIVLNNTGLILQANARAEKIFGYIKKELIGKPVDILIPERFRKSHDEHVKNYVQNPRKRFMGEELGLYGLRKDGTEFPVDIALSYVSTKDGIIISSIVRDITQHKQMEEAIRVSEEKFRRIFENAAEGIFQISTDWRILAANPACVNLLGYASSEELIAGVPDVRKLYAEPGRRLHLLRMIKEKGLVSDFEAVVSRKDGSKIWVSINAHALRDTNDNIIGLEGMVIDITRRKRAQKNFQMLIDGTPDAIIAIERNSNILLINSKTEKLFGYNRLELLGRPYDILIPMRYRKKHVEYCMSYFENPSTKIMALHLSSVAKCKDGSEFPVEINMSPVETDEGIIAVIDIRDISEKKE